MGGGIYLEFGVYKGETVNLIAAAVPDKIVYGFDSFEGLPEDWRYDLRFNLQKGAFNLNGNAPQVNENVRLVKGRFNETLPEFVKEHTEPCAFIHVDCDLYSSTKTIFDNLKNQIVSGTVIAFDEYFNYPGWQEGEYKAFMEYVEENNIEFEYIARTDYEQVAVRIK
ncbi:MAG: class I SAM-dependent methyltransferase [Selenomonadaceae bacterium]|nr:class I SAM-dependent methyltransferase [Selenomonadaceae bacterium]